VAHPSDSNDRGLPTLRRLWPVVIGALVYAICSVWAAHLAQKGMQPFERSGIVISVNQLSVLSFIRRDLYVGLPNLVLLLVGTALGGLVYRANPPCGRILLWSPLVLGGRQVWRAAVIQAHNQGTFWSPETPRWEVTTFGSYLSDPLISGGETGVLIMAVLLAIGLSAFGRSSQ
jgi:hypothetical protein